MEQGGAGAAQTEDEGTDGGNEDEGNGTGGGGEGTNEGGNAGDSSESDGDDDQGGQHGRLNRSGNVGGRRHRGSGPMELGEELGTLGSGEEAATLQQPGAVPCDVALEVCECACLCLVLVLCHVCANGRQSLSFSPFCLPLPLMTIVHSHCCTAVPCLPGDGEDSEEDFVIKRPSARWVVVASP